MNETRATALMAAHRSIEEALEGFSAGISQGIFAPDTIMPLIAEHYAAEEPILSGVHDALAAKMRAQHAEALELGAALNQAVTAGNLRDAEYLARRFVAIVQHNIIEEERDLFTL